MLDSFLLQYIENLESMKKLQTLNLSCNMIEKIEKLEKLTQLRELNVSFNSLTKIENLQTLTNIQMLNLNGNQIEHIPNWLPKKLKALRTFRIAKNNIQSVSRDFVASEYYNDLSFMGKFWTCVHCNLPCKNVTTDFSSVIICNLVLY